MNRRKVCVVLVDRANYGRMWPVMDAIERQPRLQLQTVCSGSMLLDRFGRAVDLVQNHGFQVDAEIYVELEGSRPVTMAKSVGFAIIEFASEFQKLKPDIILLIGDRYEALSAAVAAAYLNICIAHIQGGEVSGSIDESARHAISKLAHYHFPATERAKEYLIRMGENPNTVFKVGCPVGDYISGLDGDLPPNLFSSSGVGASLDPTRDFLLVIYHPVSTKFGQDRGEADQILLALEELQIPTVWLWPNIDAGADTISKALRIYREDHKQNNWLHLLKNLNPELFQKALKRTVCAVGNSSSFVRDSSFSGTPVVLVGDRQNGRDVAENVQFVNCERGAIRSAVEAQVANGRYPKSELYGDGNASDRIVAKLVSIDIYHQKRLHYETTES